jgi:hypothetical protein
MDNARSSAATTLDRRGPKLARMLEAKVKETQAFFLIEWEKRVGKRSERGISPSQRPNQKDVVEPSPTETLEMERKESRPTIISFQMGVSR